MPMFEGGYTYMTEVEDVVVVEAKDIEEAGDLIEEKLDRELPDEVRDIDIQYVREVKTNG